jgi:ABC-2 type transport system permease protein
MSTIQAGRTLSFWTETRRQASRRRTQLALGFMAVLPLIVLIAFQIDQGGGDRRDGNGQFSQFSTLATGGGLNFALFTLLVSSGFLLTVVVALFCGDTVASEASWGSLRYLLAIPIPRGRLLAVKLAVAGAYSALALLVLTGVGLAAGTARYGWHPLLAPVGGEFTTGAGLLRLLEILGYLAMTLLVVGSLAFLLSVLTDAPLGAVGGAVLLYIVSSILDQITALGSIRAGLPTHYSEAWLGLLSAQPQVVDVAKGCVSALIYGVVFFSLAWWRFLRKDIVS